MKKLLIILFSLCALYFVIILPIDIYADLQETAYTVDPGPFQIPYFVFEITCKSDDPDPDCIEYIQKCRLDIDKNQWVDVRVYCEMSDNVIDQLNFYCNINNCTCEINSILNSSFENKEWFMY